MIAPALNSLAQASAARLLDSLVEGAALAAFAALLLRFIPRQNAATRFAIWFSVVVGTVLLPLLGGWASAPVASPSQALLTVPARWAEYLAIAWMMAACIALARFAHGLLELRRLRSLCRSVEDSELDPVVRGTLDRFAPVRRVALLVSDTISVPTAIGFFSPAVILPAGMLGELSPAELNQVLLHELAHLRRWDDWTNVVLQLVKSVLYFHPAVWWVESRIALEREMACDDAVLAETGSARAYAECLTRLAERSFLRRTAALAQAAVGHARHATVARVARILRADKPAKSPARIWALSLVGGFGVVCLVVAAHAPRLVSFATPPMMAQAAAKVSPEVHYAAARHDGPPATMIYANAVDHSREVAHPPVAKAKPVRARQPLVLHKPGMLQASLTDVNVPAPPVVLVYFIEGRSGAAVWRICIWQVTVQQSEPGQVRKSI